MELNPDEVDYINQQQGNCCKKCGCSLRAMTLADSIIKHYGFRSNFIHFTHSKFGRNLNVLEINSASRLHAYLMKFKRYTFAEYPKIDMQKLPYNDNRFDMVIHSDTLEHVENSVKALKECNRVLKPNGALFYTIPIIIGRLTKSRDGLPSSFHGTQVESQGLDYKVFKEYGADFWVELLESGFTNITINNYGDKNTIAISAVKINTLNEYRFESYPIKYKIKEVIKKLIRK